MIPNPWIILGFVGFLLLSVGGASWLAYDRGRDDMRNAQTEQALATTKKALTDSTKRQGDGQQAAKEHDDHEQAILDAFRHIRTGPAAVVIRPDTDPFVPVWAVRLFDRSASGNPSGDPYPGKSDADPSDVKLSEAIAMLSINFEGCQVNRSRLIDIIHLEPILPALPPATEKPSLLERINPF
jgi:hypothetical protein